MELTKERLIQNLLARWMPTDASIKNVPRYMALISSKDQPQISDERLRLKILKRVNLDRFAQIQELMRRLQQSEVLVNKKSLLIFLLKVQQPLMNVSTRLSIDKISVNIERLLKQSLQPEYVSRYKPHFMKLLAVPSGRKVLREEEIVKKIMKTCTNKAKDVNKLHLRLKKFRTKELRQSILYLLYKARDAPLVCLVPLIGKRLAIKPVAIPPTPIALKPKHSVSKLEKELLNDLLCTLQGFDGNYLKYSHLEEKFVISTSYSLRPLIKLLEEVSELGCLYRKVQKYITSEHISLSNLALAQCLQNELSEYYRLIAVLKQDQELTSKKAHLWLSEPLETMKWLAILSEANETLKGSEVISCLFSYLSIGEAQINSLITKFINQVSVPFMDMVELWITEGELNDPYHEFFIEKDLLSSIDSLWTSRFSILPDSVPNIFDRKTVEMIFIIGKSINFLKICCKKEWKITKNSPRPQILDKVQMKSWISGIADQINKEVIKSLFEDFRLAAHCMYIKKFLLIGQGDFIHSLMEQLLPVLSETAKKIHKHTLRLILENSIKNSNLQYEDQTFLNLIDIKILDFGPLDYGWNVFTLDYLLSTPITTIFTSDALEIYQKIFKFLWHAKRAQFLLNEFQHIRLLIALSSGLQKLTHKLMVFRNSLRQFINNLVSYLLVECVESSWKEFFSRLFKAKDIDELILTHNKYVKILLDKTLINEKEVYVQIMGLLNICIKSQDLQEAVIRIASPFVNFEDCDEEIEAIDLNIDKLSTQFSRDIKRLIQLLDQTENNQYKSLTFRLDFNEFYELQEIINSLVRI